MNPPHSQDLLHLRAKDVHSFTTSVLQNVWEELIGNLIARVKMSKADDDSRTKLTVSSSALDTSQNTLLRWTGAYFQDLIIGARWQEDTNTFF